MHWCVNIDIECIFQGKFSVFIVVEQFSELQSVGNVFCKEAGEFWWTSVKWRRPFILGAAILEYHERTFSLGITEL